MVLDRKSGFRGKNDEFRFLAILMCLGLLGFMSINTIVFKSIFFFKILNAVIINYEF